METFLLIDGENFKGKIRAVFKDAGKGKPVWHEYNFKSLLDRVLDGLEVQRKIFYFVRIKEHKDTKDKSRQLIQEQRLLKTHLESQSYEVVLTGRVRGIEENSKKKTLIFKEKGVDVKIAVDMVLLSCDKKAKEIILGSSDSDLQPAITAAKERGVSCIYLGFQNQPNKGLSYTTNKTILIRNSEVLEFEKM